MTENDRPRRIVVGVDGSENAAKAARWAAQVAEERGMELHLAHALNFPAQIALLSAIPLEDVRAKAYAQGEDLVNAARQPLADAHPKLNITSTVSELGAAETLVELSKTADMVVAGSRGHGGFAGLLLGSTGLAVATHAHCPAVIVRD
jgi:nucleotide-binding universal stress UspA family protein